jgi:DMSO/TMAO reductase YedYZ heme-binding membrane subunit
MDKLYLWVIKYRNPLVYTFIGINCLLAIIWYVSFQAIVMGIGDRTWFYQNAVEFGQIALVTYCITTIPGIFRRFGIFHKSVSIIMIFRRYIGIMTYMFVLLHVSIQRLFFWMQGHVGLVPTEVFQLAGFIAFLILFSLFITSNDWSVSKLGKWWHVIHNLTYIIAWLIFAHVALQRLSVWTFIIGFTSLAVLSSHIYAKRKLMVSKSV